MDSNGLGSNSLPGTGGTGGTGAGGTGGDGGDGDGGKFSTFIPLPAANGSPETPERGRQNGRGRRPGNTLLTLSGPQLPQAGTDGKGFPGPGLPADARRRPRGDRVRPAVVGAGETAAGFRKEAVTETAALVHHDDGR
ncbi:hypothetical protein [Streptomyces sp. NPDC051567]|uniref:hypothetical protein n=1 Tax=Streptomyces sp. NPDC051567 TaxID=3365660 RepID=UPI00378F3B72